jgi:hypothetical protein
MRVDTSGLVVHCRYNVALGKIAKLDGHQTVLKVQIARLRLQVSLP